MRRGSAADRFRSVVLETLTTFPIPHDCLKERAEAFGVLAGFHGTDLVLKGAKALLENGSLGGESMVQTRTRSACRPFHMCSARLNVVYGVQMSITPR